MKKPSDTTFAYVLRNFLFLLPIVALPVALLVVFQREKGTFDLLADIARKTFETGNVEFKDFFGDLYSKVSLINFDRFANGGLSKAWFWILTAVVVAMSFSIAVAVIERHMRLGVMSPFKWVSMFKTGTLNTILYMSVMFFFYEVCMVVLSGFILLNARVMDGWWVFGVSAFATFAVYTIFIIGFCFLLLTVPSMVCDGYRFGFAASYSIHLVSAHFKRFVGVFILTSVVSTLVLQVLKFGMFLFVDSVTLHILLYIIRTVNFLWWLMFVPTYAIRNYMDYTEASRRDLTTQLFS